VGGRMNGRQRAADGEGDGERWYIAQAFEPVGGETVNEWGTNKRMETADRRRQTAVYRWTTVDGGSTAQSFRPAGGYRQRRGERTFVYSLIDSMA
jgi:hypothetical protein